jgi:hypothetical protein
MILFKVSISSVNVLARMTRLRLLITMPVGFHQQGGLLLKIKALDAESAVQMAAERVELFAARVLLSLRKEVHRHLLAGFTRECKLRRESQCDAILRCAQRATLLRTPATSAGNRQTSSLRRRCFRNPDHKSCRHEHGKNR